MINKLLNDYLALQIVNALIKAYKHSLAIDFLFERYYLTRDECMTLVKYVDENYQVWELKQLTLKHGVLTIICQKF